ncbi:MAG: hypothetical protein EXR27_11485 [Betaproteobacteria bacterium]|nr:hypothetical protein [Betaproteobacteria bacterium]
MNDPKAVLVIEPTDNVATSLVPLSAGEEVTAVCGELRIAVKIRTDIPFGHKLALADIAKGGDVRKYGAVVARATTAIARGEHVHVHNVESNRGRGDIE